MGVTVTEPDSGTTAESTLKLNVVSAVLRTVSDTASDGFWLAVRTKQVFLIEIGIVDDTFGAILSANEVGSFALEALLV